MSKTTIDLDLDALKRDETIEPFKVKIGGKQFVLPNILEADFRELKGVSEATIAGDVMESLKLLIPEQDREEFLANPLPTWKIKAIFEQYVAHYGISSSLLVADL